METTTFRSITGETSGAGKKQAMFPESVGTTVSIGARKVLLEDVLLVAVHGARVDVHQTSLDKACANAPEHKAGSGGDGIYDVR